MSHQNEFVSYWLLIPTRQLSGWLPDQPASCHLVNVSTKPFVWLPIVRLLNWCLVTDCIHVDYWLLSYKCTILIFSMIFVFNTWNWNWNIQYPIDIWIITYQLNLQMKGKMFSLKRQPLIISPANSCHCTAIIVLHSLTSSLKNTTWNDNFILFCFISFFFFSFFCMLAIHSSAAVLKTKFALGLCPSVCLTYGHKEVWLPLWRLGLTARIFGVKNLSIFRPHIVW